MLYTSLTDSKYFISLHWLYGHDLEVHNAVWNNKSTSKQIAQIYRSTIMYIPLTANTKQNSLEMWCCGFFRPILTIFQIFVFFLLSTSILNFWRAFTESYWHIVYPFDTLSWSTNWNASVKVEKIKYFICVRNLTQFWKTRTLQLKSIIALDRIVQRV